MNHPTTQLTITHRLSPAAMEHYDLEMDDHGRAELRRVYEDAFTRFAKDAGNTKYMRITAEVVWRSNVPQSTFISARYGRWLMDATSKRRCHESVASSVASNIAQDMQGCGDYRDGVANDWAKSWLMSELYRLAQVAEDAISAAREACEQATD